MKLDIVFKWLDFETGIYSGKVVAKYSLIKLEFVVLTIGKKIELGI